MQDSGRPLLAVNTLPYKGYICLRTFVAIASGLGHLKDFAKHRASLVKA